MVRNEKTVVIHRPIEEVFAFVSDLENAPLWQPELLEVRRTTEGALGIGTKFASIRKFMGRKVEAIAEFVAFRANSQVVFRSTSGPVPFDTSYLVESTAEGTRLMAMVELQPKGLMRFWNR